MTSLQRREQLIEVGRSLFAAKGFEAVSVEEIAAHAKVSKPIVYEHFGGKEGLYAVIVDREMRALTGTLTAALDDPTVHPRRLWNARRLRSSPISKRMPRGSRYWYATRRAPTRPAHSAR